MNEKVRDFFKHNFGYFIVTFICGIYIATAILSIEQTGKTIQEIIADGAVAFMLGVSINRVFDLQGMMNGDRDEKVRQTVLLHSEMVERIAPFIDRLDDWCEIKNKEALKIQRTRILAREGMKYSDCFDEDGVALPVVPDNGKLADKYLRTAEMRRLKCLKKAINLQLTQLSAGVLTSEVGRKEDPNYLGRTKQEYESRSSIKDVLTKIVMACILGYYGAGLIENFSYAMLIWKALQVGLFVIMGVIKMYQSYIFVTDEYRGRVIKKIDNLQKFENYISKGGLEG